MSDIISQFLSIFTYIAAEFAKNIDVHIFGGIAVERLKIKIRMFSDRVRETYRYYSDKRFTTVAGTLVYFFLMSLAPFLFWLSLFFGGVDLSRFESIPVFSAALPFLQELQSSAGSAAGGAGIVLIVTTLYSSTNFFYHLRRSGEIIYDSKFKKGGIKLRFASLGLILSSVVLVAVALGAVVAGERFLRSFINVYVSQFIVYSAALVIVVVVAALLNMFICPYKTGFSDVLPGSLLTVLLWLLCGIGFAVYVAYANPARLYGRIASVFVFLLWCYLMMNSFVIGVIYNGRHCVGLRHSLNRS